MGAHLSLRHAPVLGVVMVHLLLIALALRWADAPSPSPAMQARHEAMQIDLMSLPTARATGPVATSRATPPAQRSGPAPATTTTPARAVPAPAPPPAPPPGAPVGPNPGPNPAPNPAADTGPETRATASPLPMPSSQTVATNPPSAQAPSAIYQPAPHYPPMSRRLGEQGTVLLRLRTSPDGHVVSALVQRSSGHPRLDEAAVQAAQRWRLAAAASDAVQVTVGVLLPIRFVLDAQP